MVQGEPEEGEAMICARCNRNLTRCICDDAEERIRNLGTSPYLLIDWQGILAVRHLNKFDIERDREANSKTEPL